MAWISGLAGKAENLLNKIDKNTAAALNKDQNNIVVQKENDGTWISSKNGFTSTSINQMPIDSPSHSSYMKLLQNTPITPSKINKDIKENFSLFINSSKSTPTKSVMKDSSYIASSTPSSLSNEYSTDNRDSVSEYSTHSSRSSTGVPETLVVEVLNIDENEDEIIPMPEDYPTDVYSENTRLKSELEELQNELLMANHVEESIESERSGMLQKWNALKQEYEYKLTQQRLQIEHLSKVKNAGNKKMSKTQRHSEQKNGSLLREQRNGQEEIETLKEKLRMLETENAQYLKQITDLRSTVERNRLDLQSVQQDLEQHRARAIKTLQEKDKLISELRDNNWPHDSDNSMMNMELQQLTQECDVLRQENQQICKQLKIAREELVNADMKIEEASRKIASASKEAHEVIVMERLKRTEAENDARVHIEEARKFKDELTIEANNYAGKLRKQEAEILRLRSQLSAVSTPSSAVESRLATLTRTLVTKQNELELLTTEKNALRLQLEKIEHEYRELLNNSRKLYSINDTDDIKAQMPTFLMETPFDTGVTRRVKRAYSSLDAISVRIGRFLRSYPLARIFVIIYIGLLQFWVLIVLFSQSPDIHSQK